MPSCYLCNKTFLHFEALLNHFKFEEFLNSSSTYQCNELNCPMTYQNLFRFKRHYLNKHKNTYIPICLTNMQNHAMENTICSNVEPSRSIASTSKSTDTELISPDKSNSQSTVNIDDIINIFSKATIEFKTQMHTKHNFSRNDIQEIQIGITEHLTSKFFLTLNNFISPKIESEEDKIMIHKLFEFCSKPFEHIKSEHLYFKQLKDLGIYVDATEFVINEETEAVLRVGEPKIKEIRITGMLMPLSFIFKKFFELPEVLEKTLANTKYLESLPDGEIANFINCKVWKDRIRSYPNKICIPFFLYFDDFEINDPLKPHTCGIGAALINFPTLPTVFCS